MAENKEKTVVAEQEEMTVDIPEPRIHIDQFLATVTDINELTKLAFKRVIGKQWMRENEWNDCLKSYLGK
jgi:hypothetical protein